MELSEVLEITKNVQALLCEKDKEALYRYAKEVSEGGIIVDIGTAQGGSAFIMALSSKSTVKVYTIDPKESDSFLQNRERFGLKSKLENFTMTSDMAFDYFKDSDIDMLFIDGVHSYDGVMHDYHTFGQRVKTGGIIAFHDVLLHDNTVGFAVNDLIKDGQVQELETVVDFFKGDLREIGLTITKKL